jgi:uncharacterized protein DUF3300
VVELPAFASRFVVQEPRRRVVDAPSGSASKIEGEAMTSFRLRVLAQTLPFLLITPGLALAQHAPTRGEATAALNQPAKPGSQQYTRQQIDQLVAPIALYPDQLLSQVLMAATYPDQVVQAAQWVQDQSHDNLKGDELAQALEPLPWDPSVKALVPFPQILVMMSEHIEWTEALGVAFATQQREVMARVQALRHLAMKSGRLAKVKHLKVQEEGQAIVITEAEPGRIFVPVYNPTVVYGQWPDREFPPVFIPPPQSFVSETIEPGLEVSVAYTAVRPLWGWSRVDWRDQRITVDRTEYTRITRNVEVGPGDTWRHRGPVVLVSPTAVSRTTTVTTNVPAGTVAPARAAAVTVLPQRAAADPAQIKTQTSTTETRTTEPGRAQTTTTQPGTTQGRQTETTTTNPPGAQPEQNRATAQPGATQPEKAQSGTTQPQNAQTGTQSGTQPQNAQTGTQQEHGQARTNREESRPGRNEATTARPGASQPGQASSTAQPGATEPGKAAPGKPETATGQTAPGKSEANTARPNERQMRHPEAAGSSQEKREGATTAPKAVNRLNEKEAVSPSGAAKPSTGSAAQERERAKTPAGASQQLGSPEREGRGMPGQEEHPSARGPERNGAAAMPGQQMPGQHENPARAPEHAGSSAPPAAQHPAAQPPAGHGPEHVGAQPPAGAPGQANAPHRPGPEAGQGSSTPPAAAAPHAQPSAQKPQQPEHAGRPEQKEQNEKKER